jgi:hypothetical protein
MALVVNSLNPQHKSETDNTPLFAVLPDEYLVCMGFRTAFPTPQCVFSGNAHQAGPG